MCSETDFKEEDLAPLTMECTQTCTARGNDASTNTVKAKQTNN